MVSAELAVFSQAEEDGRFCLPDSIWEKIVVPV